MVSGGERREKGISSHTRLGSRRKECLTHKKALSDTEKRSYAVVLAGIIPALESAHAVAWAIRLAPTLPKDQHLLVNLSGRGDKDADYVAKVLNL